MNRFLPFLLLLFSFIFSSSQTATLPAIYSGSTTATAKMPGDMDSIGDGSKRGYVKFDLSSMPASAIVTSATLQYYNYSGGGSGINNSIFALNSDPSTASASTLYSDCGDAFPVNTNLANLAWTQTVPFLYTTTLNASGLTLINARIGGWVGMGFTRDAGGTIQYHFRGYTNAANPPKLQLVYYIPAPCNATPAPGILSANNFYPCTGETVTLSLNGTSLATGLGFQWQKANVGSNSWSNITGAVSAIYTLTTTGSFDYRCIVSCLSVSKDSISNVITLNVGGVNTFPYNENFENTDGGWRGVDLGSGINEWIWGTPAKINMNSAGNGLKCWNTNLVSDYSDLANNALESPCLNFTNVPYPRLAFSMRYRTEVDYDGLFLDVSTDGGINWSKVPQNNIIANTYNNTSTFAIFTPPAWSGDNGGWLRYIVTLPTLGGVATAKIRVHFQSDNFVTDEGVGFDSVSIANTFYDVAVSSIISPVNSCNISTSNPVKISLTNLGLTLTAGTKIPVSYKVNNGSVYTDTIFLATNKLIGDTFQYTFSTGVSMGGFGFYNFKIWATMANDSDRANDTLSKIISIVTINSFPYSENFEVTDGAWTSKIVTGTLNDFYWGTPSKTFISAAASGTKCWVTKYTNNYENFSNFALESPCLNLNSGVSPSLQFSLKFKTEMDFDGCILESSINGGLSWTKVTNFLLGGYNNTATTGVLAPPQWSGSSAGWQRVKVPLTAFLGQSNLKFRLLFASDDSFTDEGVAIDSISITDLFSKDVGVAGIMAPTGGCGLTANTPLTIKIKNFGKQLAVGTKIPLRFQMVDFNNIIVSAGSDTITLSSVFNFNDSLIFTFTSKLNLSLPGAYYITAFTKLANDSDSNNDIISNFQVISRSSISTFPYFENFEISDGNWYGEAINGNANNEWGWNFLAKPIINYTPNGQQCWLTNPFNNYANNTNDALYSPCFDFSSMANPELAFIMRFRIQQNNDAMVLESSINGGFSWQRVDSSNAQSLYNNTSVSGGIQPPKWSGDNLIWRTYKVNLANLNSQSNVQFRFRFLSDGTGNDEGAAIDSVIVYDNRYNDLSMVAITSPISKCGLSATENVTITIKNLGNVTLPVSTAIPVSYKINNGVPVDEIFTLTSPLAPNNTVNYNFTKVADLSAPGTYIFKVYTSYPSDINLNNDTIGNYAVATKAVVSLFPYNEGFESGANDWTISGINNQLWQITNTLSNPSLPANNGSLMCVFTAANYSNPATSRFTSPCFDFTTINNHGTLSFSYTESNLNAAKRDSINVLVSVNDGASWDKVAALSRYNADFTVAQWNRVDIDISSYSAQPKVLIAFDAIGRQGANFALDDINVYNSEIRIAPGIHSTQAPCPVINGSQWIDLRDNKNDLIAQINPNGNLLGHLCFGVNIVNNTLRTERTGTAPNKLDYYYFVRNLWMQSSIAPVTPVSIRFYYLPSEYNLFLDSVFNRTGITINKANLAVMNYYNSISPDDLNVLNNDYNTGASSFISPTDVLQNNYNYFSFNIGHLGELNLVYRKFVTGITELNKAIGFKIYPNPATQEITISGFSKSEDKADYSIYNSIGQRILEGSIHETETRINISTLATGVYFVKAGNDVLKFVKQ